jgi:Streptomyces sporulation and cell division protein, SsgA
MTISGTVSAELGLRLVAAEQTIVPLVASLHYSGSDPYAIRMAFHVGPEDPVEWIFARELFADGMTTPEGDGDVQVWPSVAESTDAGNDPGNDAGGTARGPLRVLNIKLCSPFGEAHFEAPIEAIASFLDRTYGIVPMGRESAVMDIDRELSSLRWQT